MRLPDRDSLLEEHPAFAAHQRPGGRSNSPKNRNEMMDRVLTELTLPYTAGWPAGAMELQRIIRNFTQREHHFGQNVWIARKGHRGLGQLGDDPGWAPTGYIVVGKEIA